MAINYTTIIYIILGVAPCLIWLAFYLKEDAHPEPKRMILGVFFLGALITVPTFFIQIGLATLLDGARISILLKSIIYWFFIISLSEELLKYLVVRLKVFNSRHLDEPLDIMLYMVIAALGFAAVENVLYLLMPVAQIPFSQLMTRALLVSFIRFLGAIFLHTLCSAVVGYSLAISFCQGKKKAMPVVAGMFIAVLLHGLYDFSIITLSSPYLKFSVAGVIILALALLVFSAFERLKKMKSVCLALPDLAKRDKIN